MMDKIVKVRWLPVVAILMVVAACIFGFVREAPLAAVLALIGGAYIIVKLSEQDLR